MSVNVQRVCVYYIEHSTIDMNKNYIARVVCHMTFRFTIWCIQVLICMAIIGIALLVSTEYGRSHAIELHRVKQRNINSYVRTGQYSPRALDIADAQAASLLYTSAYVTNVFHLHTVYDCADASSACQRVLIKTLSMWIEYQSALAWAVCFMMCMSFLARRCPVHDIIERATSEIAVYRFKTHIVTHEKAIADAFDHADRMPHGGRVMNS